MAAFPSTPVLDPFASVVNPLNGTGGWGAGYVQHVAPSNLAADASSAFSTSGYGSGYWATSYSAPREMFVTRRSSSSDDYYWWSIQVGSENGTDIVDGYLIHSNGGTTDTQFNRVDNGSGTTLFTVSSTTNVAGNQWGVAHLADGRVFGYRNGVRVGSGSDSTYLGAGYLGLMTNANVASGLDDFGGGTLVPSATATPDFRRGAFPFMPMAKRQTEPVGLAGNERESHGPGPYGGFERFIFPRLHGVPQGTTHFGESSLTSSVDITTNGVRVGLGASASTYTCSVTTVGKVTAEAATSLTATAGITTAAKLTARGASASTYTLGMTNVGKLTAFGATRFTYGDGTWGEGVFGGQPWLLTITTSGRPLKFGVVSQTLTLDITTAGTAQATKFGATLLTLTAGITTAGRLTAKGATTSTYTLSSSTAGSRTRFGTVSAPITFTAATVGRVNAKAASTQTLNLAITTAGAATKFGATSLPITFSAVTNGQIGSGISQTFTFQATTAGAKTTFGAVSRTTTVAITTAGARTTTGAVSLPITFSSTTNATRKTFGALAVPLTLSITTAGVRDPITYFGATSLPIVFSKSVAGNRVHYGTTTLPLALTFTTAATRATTGAASLTIAFDIRIDGTPPLSLDEIITGWLNGGSQGVIVSPKVGGTRHPGGSRGTIGSGASGRIKQPVGGGSE